MENTCVRPLQNKVNNLKFVQFKMNNPTVAVNMLKLGIKFLYMQWGEWRGVGGGSLHIWLRVS